MKATELEEVAFSITNLANRVNDSDSLNALGESVANASITIADRISSGIRDGLESAAAMLSGDLCESISDGKPHPGQKEEGAISLSGALLRISASLGSDDRGIRGGLDSIAAALHNAVDVMRDNNNIRANEAKAREVDVNPLVGKFFHSMKDDGSIHAQGEITAEVATGMFLVQYFGWMLGEEIHQQVVPVSAILSWRIYDSSEEMNNVYREYVRSRGRRGE